MQRPFLTLAFVGLALEVVVCLLVMGPGPTSDLARFWPAIVSGATATLGMGLFWDARFPSRRSWISDGAFKPWTIFLAGALVGTLVNALLAPRDYWTLADNLYAYAGKPLFFLVPVGTVLSTALGVAWNALQLLRLRRRR